MVPYINQNPEGKKEKNIPNRANWLWKSCCFSPLLRGHIPFRHPVPTCVAFGQSLFGCPLFKRSWIHPCMHILWCLLKWKQYFVWYHTLLQNSPLSELRKYWSGNKFCTRVFSLNFWWGGNYIFFCPLRYPSNISLS